MFASDWDEKSRRSDEWRISGLAMTSSHAHSYGAAEKSRRRIPWRLKNTVCRLGMSTIKSLYGTAKAVPYKTSSFLASFSVTC
jgi:hypothetical protein